jgi:hypothetical protein
VRQRDGGRPEGDAVRQPLLVEKRPLLLAPEERAGVQDAPGATVEPEVVLVERDLAGGGGEDPWIYDPVEGDELVNPELAQARLPCGARSYSKRAGAMR